MFYSFMPPPHRLKLDGRGQSLPTEYQCHERQDLRYALDQRHLQSALCSAPERERGDIWWIDSDGTQAEAVAVDLARAIREYALPWLLLMSDLTLALASVEADHDCFAKYVKAAFLSRQLGDINRWAHYSSLADAEGTRIATPRADSWRTEG